MKKFILLTILAVLALSSVADAAMTYGAAYYRERISMVGDASSTDPLWLFIDEVETTLDGTSGVTAIIFTPGTQPASTEGTLYYDSTAKNLKLRTDAAWVDIDVSGASSLDAAYGIGAGITVDAGAVTLTATDAANNDALTVIQSDATGATSALVITNAGTGASIEIDGSSTGDDITGTGDTWTISEAGVASLVGIILGGTDLVMEQGDTFNNTDDDVFEFTTDDKEDFEIDLSGTNIVKFTSDSTAITLEFDSLDRFTGVEDITFDAEAGNITLTADAGGEDLTISQPGSVDASVIISSAGTGTDAVSLISTAADISLVSADNITRTAADDITDVTTAGAYTLTIGGASAGKYISTVADTFSLIAVDTVLIQNTEASKDITVNSVAGSVVIEGEEDAANAVLITADGGTTTTMKLHNDTGTAAADGVSSIQLLSDLGGIGIKATGETDADAIVIAAVAGGIQAMVADEKELKIGNAGLDAYLIVAASAAAGSEDVRLVNTNGTDDAAIALTATAGGITAQVADEKNLTLGNAAGDAYVIVAASATAGNEDVRLVNTNGTAVGAIEATATAGGVDINAKEMFTVDVAGGTAGTSDIILTNTTGTDVAAIALIATAGGVDINAKEMFTVDVAGGTAGTADIILTNSVGTDNAAIAIITTTGGIDINAKEMLTLDVAAGTAGTADIIITNTPGTDVAAVAINAVAGGVTITAAKPLKIEAALTLNDVQTIGQSDDTPDVGGYSYFNTGTAADVIDDFDGAIEEGQIIVVVSKAAITYDITGGALICGTTDLVTAAEDVTVWVYDGTNWLLISWIDNAVDQNGRG